MFPEEKKSQEIYKAGHDYLKVYRGVEIMGISLMFNHVSLYELWFKATDTFYKTYYISMHMYTQRLPRESQTTIIFLN